MLSISSTLYEIQQAHVQDGINMKQIARALSVGENKLRRILTAAGFEYDASLKKWRYVRMDDVEILQRSFWSLDEYGVGNPDNKSNTGNIRSNTGNMKSNMSDNDDISDGNKSNIKSNIEGNTGNISNKNSNTDMPFTDEEIAILKAIAATHIDKEPVTDSTDILQAIQMVSKGKTTKKTFAISNDVIEQLDAFCDMHRIKKSDFIMLAIQDTLKRFQ